VSAPVYSGRPEPVECRIRLRERRSAVTVDSRRPSQIHRTGLSAARGLSGGAFQRGPQAENAERTGHVALTERVEEELSLEELDCAASKYAPYITNIA
jgi:hypothetical protein